MSNFVSLQMTHVFPTPAKNLHTLENGKSQDLKTDKPNLLFFNMNNF